MVEDSKAFSRLILQHLFAALLAILLGGAWVFLLMVFNFGEGEDGGAPWPALIILASFFSFALTRSVARLKSLPVLPFFVTCILGFTWSAGKHMWFLPVMPLLVSLCVGVVVGAFFGLCKKNRFERRKKVSSGAQ